MLSKVFTLVSCDLILGIVLHRNTESDDDFQSMWMDPVETYSPGIRNRCKLCQMNKKNDKYDLSLVHIPGQPQRFRQ